MTRLIVQHRTTFRYRETVQLGVHRLMLRPRENCDVKLASFELNISPNATVSWQNDVFGKAK